MTEAIAQAAIRFGEELWTVENPGRHHTISHAWWAVRGPMPIRVEEAAEDGFVTTTGRFVDRYEAARIAYAAGQTTEMKYKLFSEDLW